MANFTSNTYKLKREILTFTNKISKHIPKPERKFTADITYGIMASGSCLLTDNRLHHIVFVLLNCLTNNGINYIINLLYKVS
ncbi:MAG: hypothetical protein PHY47_18165 [Lachnospiraceae bacterium]|nr:hypothetical protein [Lachnospiraceae bacterium]